MKKIFSTCIFTSGMALAALPVVAPHARAQTRPVVATDSAVFVERSGTGASRLLEPASQLVRGDRVVTVLSWRRITGAGTGPAGFVITNPMPSALSYQQSAREGQEVSVDGGHTWGRLGTLRIGTRPATPEDVTHVRWRIAANAAARGFGQIAYSGIVR